MNNVLHESIKMDRHQIFQLLTLSARADLQQEVNDLMALRLQLAIKGTGVSSFTSITQEIEHNLMIFQEEVR
jgi:hypothetical protein